MILKTATALLSPAGNGSRLSILIFHRVLAKPDPIFPGEPDARRFDEILSWVGRWFQVLPLDEAASRLSAGTLPARALAITFDDGYADNAQVALPILQRHGMVATFFVATSFLDGGRMWNDTVIEAVRGCSLEKLDLSDLGFGTYSLASPDERRHAIESLLGQIKYRELGPRNQAVEAIARQISMALPDDLMMSSDQIRQLRHAGMQIGAHTCSHPILASLSDAQAMAEIVDGKDQLEEIIGEAVTLFAYPNGKPGRDYLAKHAAMAEAAGFAAAVSTAPGVSSLKTDPFQLPRFTPWDRQPLKFGVRMLANLLSAKPQTA